MFTRKCAVCNKESFYTRKDSFVRANKENRNCQSCNMKEIWLNKPFVSKVKKHIHITSLKREEFIFRASKIHNNKYLYDEIDFISYRDKVKIICPVHGSFWQTPNNHVNNKQGCSKCAKVASISNIEAIERCKIVHGDKYNYDLVSFVKVTNKVIIICPKHGQFVQGMRQHYSGQGCPSCSKCISKKEISWLNSLNIPNDICHRHVSIMLDSRKYNVDGYQPETKTIYEFYGDIFHGNPQKFDLDQISPICKVSYKILYEKTQERENILKSNGFKIISAWESDYDETNAKMFGGIESTSFKIKFSQIEKRGNAIIKELKNA